MQIDLKRLKSLKFNFEVVAISSEKRIKKKRF